MEITRSGILMEVLEEQNRQMHKYSRHGAGLIALPGYEQLFDDLSAKCKLLRAMVIENVDRERETKVADWQLDIIKGKQPGVEWADEQPMTPDEALLRRRYRKADGFKPAPVTYPGGEEDGNLQD